MKKLIFTFIISILLLTGCSYNYKSVVADHVFKEDNNSIDVNDNIGQTEEETPIEVEVKEPVINQVSLAAVGDIMVHRWQMTRAYDSKTDTFDFSHAFKYIKSYLEEPDIMIGNLETTFAGKNKGASTRTSNKIAGYSEYPMFNSPEVLGKNLKEAGFDLVTTANNHSLDSSYDGLVSTLDFLDQYGLEHVGTYRTQEEKDKLYIKEINNIKFGFIGYTNSTNGLQLPKDKKFALNNIDFYSKEKIDELLLEVKGLRQAGAEIIVVMVHFGNEYVNDPDSHQKDLVDKLFDAGADVILGSHPHVLQPIEVRKIKDGNREKNGVVIYSLGNFISSQKYNSEQKKNKDIGVILQVDFEKVDDNPAEIKGISLIPTFSYWSKKEISVLPVKEVNDNLESYKDILDSYSVNRIKYSSENTINHLLKYVGTKYEYVDYRYNVIFE